MTGQIDLDRLPAGRAVRKARRGWLLAAAAAMVIAYPMHDGVAMSISALPIEGWVVDASGAPIEDVVVLAHWVLEGPMEGHIAGQLQIMETTTDKAGHYALPGWGPKRVADPNVVMLSSDPILHFFKSGYRLVTLHNRTSVSAERAKMERRSSDWNGKRIEVERMDGNEAAYSSQFDSGGAIVIRLLAQSGNDCEWKQMRRMLTMLNIERLRLEAQGVHTLLPRPERFSNQARCGPASKWLLGEGQ